MKKVKLVVDYFDYDSKERIKVLTFNETIRTLPATDRDKIISKKLRSVKKIKSVKEIT